MKTMILALVALLFSVTGASAQFCTPQYTPTAADKAQLPYAVEIPYAANVAGWKTDVQWMNHIWPRNAAGAWYRPVGYSPLSASKNPVFGVAVQNYTCVAVNTPTYKGFVCRDHIRGIDRSVACPTSIFSTPPTKWRSLYNSAWRNQGCFNWSQGPFGATVWRSLPVREAVVTAAGKQVNCSYGNALHVGPGTTMDHWVFRP